MHELILEIVRDIIWTIIVIWIIWKVYDAFKIMSKQNTKTFKEREKIEVKIDENANMKSHFNMNDVEYVDYEEIK